MKKNRIYVLGVGHNTAVYVDLVESLGYEVSGLYHYQEGRTGDFLCGHEIIGSNEDLLKSGDLEGQIFCLSMGDSAIRRKLAKRLRGLGGKVPSLIHPAAVVSKYASLEEGVVVQANSTIQANAIIGADTVISFNVGVTHDSKIGPGVYVAGNSIVGAYVNVCSGAFVGMGSVLISGKVDSVGEGAIVGAGSVVAKNVEAYSIVAGNPAKIIGKVERGILDEDE